MPIREQQLAKINGKDSTLLPQTRAEIDADKKSVGIPERPLNLISRIIRSFDNGRRNKTAKECQNLLFFFLYFAALGFRLSHDLFLNSAGYKVVVR